MRNTAITPKKKLRSSFRDMPEPFLWKHATLLKIRGVKKPHFYMKDGRWRIKMSLLTVDYRQRSAAIAVKVMLNSKLRKLHA